MKADRKQAERLLKTARGQIDGILKMIDDDRYCIDISNQLMAVEAIIRKVNREVLKAHLKCCVKTAVELGEYDEKIDELTEIFEKISR